MDTKLKKFKGIISFVCLFITIIVGSFSLNFLFVTFINGGSFNISNYGLEDSFKNYQNTKFFAQATSAALNLALEKRDEYAANYKNDLNMVTFIEQNGRQTMRSEHKGVTKESALALAHPEYNFLLHYKFGKVTITQNGKVIDIYGDGLFRGSNKWNVPGYSNRKATPETYNTEVIMLFLEKPTYYESYREGDNSYTSAYESIAYNTILHQKRLQKAVFILIFGMATFALLTALGVAFYKYKKLIDSSIARFTNKIYAEIKILCIILQIIIMRALMNNGYYILSLILPFIILPLWLIFNDKKYNKRFFQNSISVRFVRFLLAADMHLGVQKRFWHMFVFSAVSLSSVMFSVAAMISSFFRRYIDAMRIMIFAICLFTVSLFVFIVCIKIIRDIVLNWKTFVDFVNVTYTGGMPHLPKLLAASELEITAMQVHNMEQGLKSSVGERLKSERTKLELITNVSHDLKTPLTSVINYIDLLKDEKLENEAGEYVKILDEKAQKLKKMVEDVFEISKAASGQLPLNLVSLDIARLLRQTLADMNEQIEQSGHELVNDIFSGELIINADGAKLYRVYQNLLDNALKYAMPQTRIYLSVQSQNNKAVVSVKNISVQKLSSDIDFTQRFVRGDESRTDGGSGLGLSIASSFTFACGGDFCLSTNADLFIAETSFELVPSQDNEQL